MGEKIYDKFSTKPSTPPEIKGKEIGKMLAAADASSPPAEAKRRTTVAPEKATGRTFKKINNVYAELL